MADAKKKALIQAAAEMIRKAGAANVGEDTELVHVTPAEKAKLKAEGGSGKTDPVTGLPHFKQDKDSENSGRRDADNEGNDSKSDSRSSGHDKSDKDKDYKDKSWEALGRLAKMSPNEIEAAGLFNKDTDLSKFENKMREQHGNGSTEGTPAVIPANMTQEQRLMRQEQLATGAATQTAKAVEQANAAKKKAQSGVEFNLGLTDLNPTGALVHVGSYGVKRALAGNKAYNESLSAQGLEQGPTTNTLGASESKGSDERVKAPVADEATDTKKLAETVATPTFDDFVAKARKKKNYMSTILGGGVPSGTPQGKQLLGS